jgi:hypothetical protein
MGSDTDGGEPRSEGSLDATNMCSSLERVDGVIVLGSGVGFWRDTSGTLDTILDTECNDGDGEAGTFPPFSITTGAK